MKLYLKTKNVLDERETQEMYRIEHRGLWGMYALLCAAVVAQMFFGAGFAQIAGEAFVIAVVSVGMIAAYARHGIWDADARPSTRGNAVYALFCALGVTAITFGLHESARSSRATSWTMSNERGGRWGFAPRPTKNLRFLDFPLSFIALR